MRALLIIDVQNEYFTGKLPIQYPQNAMTNILKTIDIANSKNIPIILIQHSNNNENAQTFKTGTSEWEIHPDILNKKYNIIIEKQLHSSFTGQTHGDITLMI
ncbi:MAG: isochorismatase family protein [Methanobacteriaceae archaeon]|nr:isochorismatase family protein [Methanobacteriaceae archaeon]